MLDAFGSLGEEIFIEEVEIKVEETNAFRQKIFSKTEMLFEAGRKSRERDTPKHKKLKELCPRGLIFGDGVFDANVYDKIPPKGYTTCGDWQFKLMRYHVAGQMTKSGWRDDPNFRLKTFTMSDGKKTRIPAFLLEPKPKANSVGAWLESSIEPPRTYRPKPGDIYILKYPDDEKYLTEKEISEDRMGDISHVGYIKSIKIQPDSEEEIWITLDGGQKISGLQAVKEVTRIYNRTTNILSVPGAESKSSQDLYPRWVYGWINVDLIIE